MSFAVSWNHDGKAVPPSDLWGERGAFTTLRCETANPGVNLFFVAAHLRRLFESLRLVGVVAPVSPEKIRDQLIESVGERIPRMSGKTWLLRVSVTEHRLAIHGRPVSSSRNSLVGRVETLRRNLPEAKSLDYTEILQRMEKLDRNMEELILRAPDGRLLEGATTNLLFFDGMRFITPGRDRLPGITLGMVASGLRPDYAVIERDIYEHELASFTEVLCCGSGREITSFSRIEPAGWKNAGDTAFSTAESLYCRLKAATHDVLHVA